MRRYKMIASLEIRGGHCHVTPTDSRHGEWVRYEDRAAQVARLREDIVFDAESTVERESKLWLEDALGKCTPAQRALFTKGYPDISKIPAGHELRGACARVKRTLDKNRAALEQGDGDA